MKDFSAIIQVRIGSERYPMKVLTKLGEKTVIGRIIERLQKCRNLNKIILASPNTEENDVISLHVDRYKIQVYRGDEKDVMVRIIRAAKEYEIKNIVRVCADSPFILPWLIDFGIDIFSREEGIDYMNTVCFPLGQNIELMTLNALENAHKTSNNEEKEHVTSYFEHHPTDFVCRTLNIGLTIDVPDDYKTLSLIVYYEGDI